MLNELDLLIKAESDAYQHNTVVVGSSIELLHGMSACYNGFLDVVNQVGKENYSTDQLAMLQLLVGSKMELGAGILSLLRGHSSDCRGHMRKAIEFALFAVNLFERKGSAEKWLLAGQNTQSWDEYRQHFNLMDMLHISTYDTLSDLEKKIVEPLIAKYEDCCVQVHATPMAIAAQMKLEEVNSVHQIKFDFVDTLGSREMLLLFFTVIDAHIHIVMVFAHLLGRLVQNFKVESTYPLTGTMRLKYIDEWEKQKLTLWPEDDKKNYEKFWDLPKRSDRKKTKLKTPKRKDGLSSH